MTFMTKCKKKNQFRQMCHDNFICLQPSNYVRVPATNILSLRLNILYYPIITTICPAPALDKFLTRRESRSERWIHHPVLPHLHLCSKSEFDRYRALVCLLRINIVFVFKICTLQNQKFSPLVIRQPLIDFTPQI